MTNKTPRVLWLRPDKPKNISVGRLRIAEHLRKAGYAITVDETTLRTSLSHLTDRSCYDVIIGTTRAGALAGMVLSSFHGVPLLVDHIDPIDQFRETTSAPMGMIIDWLERLSFRQARQVLYVYPEERERVEAHAVKTIETDLGVDFQRFAAPEEEQVEAARDWLDGVSGRIAVYIGGLEPIYNIETMLEAINHLEGWTLVIAGDGKLRETVENAAADDDQIVYLGTIPHETVPGLLNLSDVGISLVDDPHTLKVLEYGAAGLPTVQLAGRAEEKLDQAVTFCKLDPENVATAVESTISEDADSLRNFAKRKSWKSIAEQYAEAIDEAVGCSTPDPDPYRACLNES